MGKSVLHGFYLIPIPDRNGIEPEIERTLPLTIDRLLENGENRETTKSLWHRSTSSSAAFMLAYYHDLPMAKVKKQGNMVDSADQDQCRGRTGGWPRQLKERTQLRENREGRVKW